MANTLSSFTLLLCSWLVLIQITFAQISFPLTPSTEDNCSGSSYCGDSELPSNSICNTAIGQFNTGYNNYDSYTSHYIEEYGTGCTAFYECDDNEYLTLNGYELQQL